MNKKSQDQQNPDKDATASLYQQTVEQYKYIQCDLDKTHNDESVNLICLKENCNRNMEAVCSICLDKQTHSHDNKFKNIKKSLKSLGTDLDKKLIENQQFEAEELKWCTEIADQFKKLGEQCTQISERINQLLKSFLEYKKSKDYIIQTKNCMEQILSTKEYKVLQENLLKLKEVTEIKGEEILIRKQYKTDGQIKFEDFKIKLEHNLKNMETFVGKIATDQ